MLRDFVNEPCMSAGSNLKSDSTFYHFNGVVTSQINYMLSSDPTLLKTYTIFERQAENLSPHVPVKAKLNIPLQATCKNSVKRNGRTAPRKVLAWKKLDKEMFNAEIAATLPRCSNENVESSLASLTNCLKHAAPKAFPSRIVKLKGPMKRASLEVLTCLKTVKQT